MAAPSSNRMVSRVLSVAGYLCALFLPWLATSISRHTPALQNTPFALNFACVAAVATLFDLGPALFAVACNVLFFNYFVLAPVGAWSLSTRSIVRSAIILAVGLLIVFFCQRLRNISKKLRSTLTELQEQTEAMIQAQQGSRSAAWVYNSVTRQTTWYKGGAEVFGRSLEELTAMGSPASLLLEEDAPKLAAAAAHTRLTGELFHVEARVAWPNGEIHWLEARGTPLREDPTLWRGVTTDVTARKDAELALIRSEKLAAAGRLAAAIAHEINNPLASITNLIYLASLTSTDPETSGYLATADKELRRITQIANQTLRFHRQQSAAAPTDMVDAVRSLLLFYESRLSQGGIAVVFEPSPTPPISCYAGEIRQVMTNLIGNAVDAMPGGGTLRIKVRPATDWRTGEAGVRITIADTGCGMGKETQARIFEPFFTTKGATGTGLGLWVSHEIVQKHGGSLSVRSSTRAGRSGSVFTLVLPYASREAASPEAMPGFPERSTQPGYEVVPEIAQRIATATASFQTSVPQ